MLAHMVQALATKDFFSSLLGPCEISLCVCVCVCVCCVSLSTSLLVGTTQWSNAILCV